MAIYGVAVLYWAIDLSVLPALGYSMEVKDPELISTGNRLEVILTYTVSNHPYPPPTSFVQRRKKESLGLFCVGINIS